MKTPETKVDERLRSVARSAAFIICFFVVSFVTSVQPSPWPVCCYEAFSELGGGQTLRC